MSKRTIRLDQGLIDLEIRRMFTVIGSNLIGGNERIDALLDQMLNELRINNAWRYSSTSESMSCSASEKFFGLVQFKLFVHHFST